MRADLDKKYYNYRNVYNGYNVYRSMEMTTIAVSKETKKKLDDRGNKGDTYDEIIQELLK